MDTSRSSSHNNDRLLAGDLGPVLGDHSAYFRLELLLARRDRDLAVLDGSRPLVERVEAGGVFDISRANIEAGYNQYDKMGDEGGLR